MQSTSITTSDMQPCIDACTSCHQACLRTALTHCIEVGGQHVEPDHFRLMMNCAEVCQACANLQLSGSAFSSHLCGLCAVLCDACGDSCERIGGMDACVQACRACAKSCHAMAGGMAH